MSGRSKSRHFSVVSALATIRCQATIETDPQVERWIVIMQAIRDLVPNSTPMDESDYPPDLYLQNELFREHASWLGLDPEWVVNVLERHGLLENGKRKPLEFVGVAA